MKRIVFGIGATIAIVTPGVLAQPSPDEPAAAGSGAGSGSGIGSGVTAPENPYVDAPAAPPPPAAPPAKPPRPRDPHISMPEVLTTPTGWLLPAAVLYSRTALDTGGGFSTDNRVGLGDVAEFGLATTDQVRAKTMAGAAPEQIEPYVTATFRMGIAEHREFEQQPGIVLGFVKSFERNHDGYKTRIAELTLVLSKSVGERTAIHLGGAFWDASLEGNGVDTSLHDRASHSVVDQIRAFGGFEARPFAKAEVLIDLGWSPELCYMCTSSDQIRLRPTLSWGVRYDLADFAHLESGVRIADIDDANLLDAQIFGQVTFTSWALRHAVDALK
jgi:hypothetical protein